MGILTPANMFDEGTIVTLSPARRAACWNSRLFRVRVRLEIEQDAITILIRLKCRVSASRYHIVDDFTTDLIFPFYARR